MLYLFIIIVVVVIGWRTAFMLDFLIYLLCWMRRRRGKKNANDDLFFFLLNNRDFISRRLKRRKLDDMRIVLGVALLSLLCLAVYGLDLGTDGCLEGSSCKYVKSHSVGRSLDGSHVPELRGGKLRVCVYDKEFSKYEFQGNDEERATRREWVLQRSLNAKWATWLAETMFTSDGAVEAEIVVIDRWLQTDYWPSDVLDPHHDEKKHACLTALSEGLCDLAICDVPSEASWLSRYFDDSSLKPIPAYHEFLKSTIVYPKHAACGASSASALCGHDVHVLEGSAEHLMVEGLNAVGGACQSNQIHVRSWCDDVHGRYADRCADHNTNATDACFLIWEANDYWYDVCRWESQGGWYDDHDESISEDDALARCDKARLTVSAGGRVWAIRRTPEDEHEELERLVISARDGLWRSDLFSPYLDHFEDSRIESELTAAKEYCCPSDERQVQECVYKSNNCVVPGGQTRCVWG